VQALHLGGVPGGLPDRGAFRTEFDTVVVQADVCNGCDYCVPACSFGVIDRREDDGRAFKCTLCYDRLRAGAFFLLLDEPEVYGLPPDGLDHPRPAPLWRAAALAAGAAVADRLGVFPRLGRAAEAVAGLLGPALATYTGTLVADTAVPVWHEPGRELPLGAGRDDREDSRGFA
jgi:ferredoxin